MEPTSFSAPLLATIPTSYKTATLANFSEVCKSSAQGVACPMRVRPRPPVLLMIKRDSTAPPVRAKLSGAAFGAGN